VVASKYLKAVLWKVLNKLRGICLNLNVEFDNEMNLNYFKLTIFGTR